MTKILNYRGYVLRSILLMSCLLFIVNHCKSQQIQIVPRAGAQFHGISYISKEHEVPHDFISSIPSFEITIGVDLRYKAKHLAHIISIQSIALGPSFGFENMFKDNGLIPSSSGQHSITSIGQALISYGIEKELKGSKKLKFHYAIQGGIGLNKSNETYDSVLAPYSYGMQMGDHYIGYLIRYKRSGIGVFLSGKAGIGLYNRRNKNTLNLQLFWHQGLKQMAEYAIYYEYGYYSRPEYQRQQQVLLKSRGTVFGLTIGIPIGILNKQAVIDQKP